MTSTKTNTEKSKSEATALRNRRGFLTSLAAGASAAVIPKAIAAPLDDSALVKIEEQIFEQREGADAYDGEIYRLSTIWRDESERLYRASLDAEGNCPLSPQERWKLVTEMPACIEHNRLCQLQEPFLRRMDALIEQMFAIPARTEDGRRAKVAVLLSCVMGDDWRHVDKETDRPEQMARALLIEFIGGEPGEMLRDQFA